MSMRIGVRWLMVGLALAAAVGLETPCRKIVGTALAAQSTEKPTGKNTRSTPGVAADLREGKEMYRIHCGICHFSTNTAKKVGPGMKALYKRGRYADGKKVNDASLRAWIEQGGKDMPGFRDVLTPQQVNNLIAYIKTL